MSNSKAHSHNMTQTARKQEIAEARAMIAYVTARNIGTPERRKSAIERWTTRIATHERALTKRQNKAKRPPINARKYTEQDGGECVHCSKEIAIGKTAWTSDFHSGGFCSRTCIYDLAAIAREID